MRVNSRLCIVCTVSILAILAISAQAGDGTWTNTASGNWDDASRWSGGIVADGSDSTASFNANATVTTGTKVTNNAARIIGHLNFRDSSGSDPWTVTNDNNDASTITLATSGATPVIATTNSTHVYLDTIMAGNQGVVVAAHSGKYLTFRRANTYSGVTTVRRGYAHGTVHTFSGQNGAFGNDTSAIQVGDSGTTSTDDLGVRLGPGVTNARPIVVNNQGGLVLIGQDNNAGAPPRVFLGDITLNRDAYIGGYNNPVEVRGTISGSGGIKIGGSISTGSNVVKLYGTNTFDGDITVSRGALEGHASNAFGNASSTIVLGDGDTAGNNIALAIRPGLTLARNVHVTTNGTGTAILGASGGAGTYNFTGTIQADRDLRLSSQTTSYLLNFLNVISGTGNIMAIGSGEIFLSATNTFTGDFIHNAGNCFVWATIDAPNGVPGPFGNATNAIRIANNDGNLHRLFALLPVVIGRPIAVEDGVKCAIGSDAATANGCEFAGDITYAGDLTIYTANNSSTLVSGKLTTTTNSLTLTGGSSAGNWIHITNSSNTLSGSVAVLTGSRLVVGASGALAGSTSIVMGANTGANPVGLLTAGSVTVPQAVYLRTNCAYNVGGPEFGSYAAGNAIFSGDLYLSRPPSAQIIQFVAASDSLVRFTGTVNCDSGIIRKTGSGVTWFEGTSTYTNDLFITAGAFGAVDGVGLQTVSRLFLTNGVFESNGSFTRTLGTAAGYVSWSPGTTHGGGFSARGGKLTVDLNGGGADNLVWASTADFVKGSLLFGSAYADSEMEWVDNIALGTANRTILVNDNPATRDDKANLSGILSGTRTILKTGAGVLVLGATNTITSNVTVSAGTLMINGALTNGNGFVTVTNGAFLGGSGTIKRRLVMLDGAGFDWANDPGTLTVATNMSFPTNGLFRFVYSTNATSKVSCTGTLTLPASATVELVALPGAGDAPNTATLLEATDLVGEVTGWTISGNPLGYSLVKQDDTVILEYVAQGSYILFR